MLYSERVKVQMPRKARERENQSLRWEMGLSDPGMDMSYNLYNACHQGWTRDTREMAQLGKGLQTSVRT